MDKVIEGAVGLYFENHHYNPSNIILHPKKYKGLLFNIPPYYVRPDEIHTIQINGAKMKIYRSEDIDEDEVKVF